MPAHATEETAAPFVPTLPSQTLTVEPSVAPPTTSIGTASATPVAYLAAQRAAAEAAQRAALASPSSPPTIGTVAPSDGAAGRAAVDFATQFVGRTPYVEDGSTPAGFDCSGLVMYTYGQFGLSVPRLVSGIAAQGTEIPASEAAPGDLVVYLYGGLGHIGIYAGGGQMVDAPAVGRDVELQAVWGTPSYVRLPGF